MARPPGGASYGGRHLVEGYVIPDNMPARSYTFYFNNGGTEGYINLKLVQAGSDSIASKKLEQKLMNYAREFFFWIRKREVDPPYGIFLSLVGVRGKELATGPRLRRGIPKRFDREKVYVPGVSVNTSQPDVEDEMRPVLDMMWQACGFDGSPYYDDDGNWSG